MVDRCRQIYPYNAAGVKGTIPKTPIFAARVDDLERWPRSRFKPLGGWEVFGTSTVKLAHQKNIGQKKLSESWVKGW